MTAPHIFNATKINSLLLTGTMFISLSRGAEWLLMNSHSFLTKGIIKGLVNLTFMFKEMVKGMVSHIFLEGEVVIHLLHFLVIRVSNPPVLLLLPLYQWPRVFLDPLVSSDLHILWWTRLEHKSVPLSFNYSSLLTRSPKKKEVPILLCFPTSILPTPSNFILSSPASLKFLLERF